MQSSQVDHIVDVGVVETHLDCIKFLKLVNHRIYSKDIQMGYDELFVEFDGMILFRRGILVFIRFTDNHYSVDQHRPLNFQRKREKPTVARITKVYTFKQISVNPSMYDNMKKTRPTQSDT